MREPGGEDLHTGGNESCYGDNKKLKEQRGVIRLRFEKDALGVLCRMIRVGEARSGTTVGQSGRVEGPPRSAFLERHLGQHKSERYTMSSIARWVVEGGGERHQEGLLCPARPTAGAMPEGKGDIMNEGRG